MGGGGGGGGGFHFPMKFLPNLQHVCPHEFVLNLLLMLIMSILNK